MNIHQWDSQIKKFNKSFENSAPKKQWNDNTIANMHRFKKENSIWNTQGQYFGAKEKAIVLVGASPRLAEDVEKLKEIDENFIIICANSALKYLLKHDIKPDYVVCIDSDDIDIPQHLDIDRDDITLLASNVVCPEALDKWKGPVWYMPYYGVKKNIKAKLKKRIGREIASGGNSMTEALWVATAIWGAHTIIFVANEYCFNKNYYADKEAAKQEKLKKRYPAIDANGNERWTLPALYTYVIWIERLCDNLTPPGYFIDTSFGLLGKDTKNIHRLKFEEAIEQVKTAFKIKEKLNKLNAKKEILTHIEARKNEQSEVFRYNMYQQRERILQLNRS